MGIFSILKGISGFLQLPHSCLLSVTITQVSEEFSRNVTATVFYRENLVIKQEYIIL